LGNRSANLHRAVACYEAELHVRTEADFPAEWAGTQNNLGNTFGDLPTTAQGTEPPTGDWASVEEERIDLGRAARGAGSPVNGPLVDTDESTTGHDPNADDADEHADDADEHADDADEHADDADEHADEHAADLDPDESIRAPGKHELDPAADEVDAGHDADVPAPDLDADDADFVRDVDVPDADPVPGDLNHRPDGVRRSSRSSPARCLRQRWSSRSSPAPTLGSRRERAPSHAGPKWGELNAVKESLELSASMGPGSPQYRFNFWPEDGGPAISSTVASFAPEFTAAHAEIANGR
jgi:hypothetical protein